MPRTWAAKAAAPAPTRAGRILEFWECLTPPAHTAPRCRPPATGAHAPCAACPKRTCCCLPHLCQQNTFCRDKAFVFAFFFLQESGAGIGFRLLSGTRMLVLRDPQEQFGGRGGLFSQEMSAASPVTFIPLRFPPPQRLVGTHPTSTPQSISRDSPNPARRRPGEGATGSDVPSTATSLAFPRGQDTAGVWGVTPAA